MTDIDNKSEENSIARNDALDDEADSEELPPQLVEAIGELPPEARSRVTASFLALHHRSSSSVSPVAEQINAQHIDKILENSDKENQREFQRSEMAEATKRYALGALLALVAIVLVYAGITKDKELSDKVMTAAIGGLGGFGIGISYAAKGRE